jgi:hypothetical protein
MSARLVNVVPFSSQKWERRKGWDLLLDAYWSEFERRDGTACAFVVSPRCFRLALRVLRESTRSL